MLQAGFALAFIVSAMTRSAEGTLMKVESTAPVQLMVNVDRQFQTFVVGKDAVAERESTVSGEAAPTRVRIEIGDLTPGEFLHLQMDAKGRVTRARAIAQVDREKVRSVDGASIVLQDGTALTIGSTLRYVDEHGKQSGTATVRPGDTVLVFRHPQTRNIYRFTAMPRSRLKKHTQHSKD